MTNLLAGISAVLRKVAAQMTAEGNRVCIANSMFKLAS